MNISLVIKNIDDIYPGDIIVRENTVDPDVPLLVLSVAFEGSSARTVTGMHMVKTGSPYISRFVIRDQLPPFHLNGISFHEFDRLCR